MHANKMPQWLKKKDTNAGFPNEIQKADDF